MATILNRNIRLMLLIGSVLMMSACTKVNTAETIAAKTDETARATMDKGKSDTSHSLQQAGAPPAATEQVNSADKAATVNTDLPKTVTSRITPKEPFVNVRKAPSLKSRPRAVLTGGQHVEILEEKNDWVKIKWQKGNAVKQGWLKKRFVESSAEK